jgi:hypothetical protein
MKRNLPPLLAGAKAAAEARMDARTAVFMVTSRCLEMITQQGLHGVEEEGSMTSRLLLLEDWVERSEQSSRWRLRSASRTYQMKISCRYIAHT